MKEIKFTTNYEQVLSFADKNFKTNNVVQYDEYKFQRCPYHKKRANYIKDIAKRYMNP